MATLSELQTKKANIEKAIDAVLNGGQEYKINDGLIDNWVKRGDLATLYKELDKVERRIETISSTGGFVGV
jgi:hypothetical protein